MESASTHKFVECGIGLRAADDEAHFSCKLKKFLKSSCCKRMQLCCVEENYNAVEHLSVGFPTERYTFMPSSELNWLKMR